MSKALNQPYGGKLVSRVESRADFRSEAPLPELRVDGITESDFFNLAVGSFSPLTGFMGRKDFESVCSRSRLAGSEGLIWTIPIVFEVSEEQKKVVERALSGKDRRVLLKSAESGDAIGYLKVEEIYPHDKDLRIKGTYGVTDLSHPGVKLVTEMGPHLVAGEVTAFEEALSKEPLSYPAQVRAKLEAMGLSQVAGFQTRNVVHRAHEHLQRVALEVTGGLLVHPVVGWKKTGDFRPEAVKIGYTRFIENYFPREKVLLAFLKLAMRYAGPKEAIFHAIVRKNYGCSHFIVGRDHAGVGGFYGQYAAHELVDSLTDGGALLGIEILKLKEPFHCRRCEGIATERTCGHPDSDREYISGTKIRKILVEGKDPEHHIFRSEVLASLRSLGERGLFYETT